MSEKENNLFKIKIAILTDKNIELQNKINKAIKKLKFIDECFSSNEHIQVVQLLQNHKEALEILGGENENK